jgi:hypothetical protein
MTVLLWAISSALSLLCWLVLRSEFALRHHSAVRVGICFVPVVFLAIIDAAGYTLRVVYPVAEIQLTASALLWLFAAISTLCYYRNPQYFVLAFVEELTVRMVLMNTLASMSEADAWSVAGATSILFGAGHVYTKNTRLIIAATLFSFVACIWVQETQDLASAALAHYTLGCIFRNKFDSTPSMPNLQQSQRARARGARSRRAWQKRYGQDDDPTFAMLQQKWLDRADVLSTPTRLSGGLERL